MSDICKSLLEIVEGKFDFLFRSEDFKVIGQQASRGEYCNLFMESESHRIKFYIAPDEFQVLVGSLSAPRIWLEKENNETHWYHITSLASYLENDTEVVLPTYDGGIQKTLEQQMDHQAMLLRKHYGAIEKLFGQGEIANRKIEYERHLEIRRKKAREAYEKLAGKG